MHPVLPYTIAALLLGLGVYGVLRRRNAVLLLMAVELMLNGVNLIFVTADATVPRAGHPTGQVFVLFIIVLAAAEVGVGLALILALYRARGDVAVDEVPLTEPEADPGAQVDPEAGVEVGPAPAAGVTG